MVSKRPPKDWNYIEELYRSGYSLRTICKKYIEMFPAEKLAPETVRKRALKYKWKKDLAPAIKKAVDRKLIEKTGKTPPLRDEVAAPRSDEQIIDDAAEAQTELILAHRKAGEDARTVVEGLVKELLDSPQMTVIRKASDGTTETIEIPLPLKEQARSIKDLAMALDRLVGVERTSHNLNDRQVLGTGTIELYTNVPNPAPLPDGI